MFSLSALAFTLTYMIMRAHACTDSRVHVSAGSSGGCGLHSLDRGLVVRTDVEKASSKKHSQDHHRVPSAAARSAR
jgi:hypothetical protein